MDDTDRTKIAWAVAAIMLLAILPFPYGFYTIVRLAGFCAGIYFITTMWETHRNVGYALIAVILVFNPLIPVHLPRAMWFPINLATAGLFGYIASEIGKRPVRDTASQDKP